MGIADLPKSTWLEMRAYVEHLLATPKYQEPKRLTRHGFKAYSQNDEDGIIAEIFRRIGETNRVFFEIGVQTGLECNTLWLLHQQWQGVWVDADETAIQEIGRTHMDWLGERLKVIQSIVSAENVEGLLRSAGVPKDLDFLSIDVDGNDYWIWKAITTFLPHLVCIECNATWAPPASITVKYDPNMEWSRTSHFGASLGALTGLGKAKGYALVGCGLSGANAFFVRQDLCGDLFFMPNSLEAHYEPPRYFLAELPSGHPPSARETQTV